MYIGHISLLAILAVLPLTLATPVNQDLTELIDDSNPVNFADDTLLADFEPAEFTFPIDFNYEEYQNDIAELDHSAIGDDDYNTTITDGSSFEKRLSDKDKHFQVYRMKYAHRACPPMGGGCVDTVFDRLQIDSDCHGGRCDAKPFMDFDTTKHLCDKKFKACGIEYVMKYTGKQGSCMRHEWFWRPEKHYWTKYAHLTRNGKNVGECLVWNKVHTGKYCSGNAWGMESVLKCWIHR